MEAKVGISALVETYGVKERIKCSLVGWSKEEFVALKAPLTPGIRSRVTTGSQLAIRYLHEGNLIGFRAEYIDFIARPFPLLFVSYPFRFEKHALRGNRRVGCNFLATVSVRGATYQGIILDISHGGCKFVFAVEGGLPKLQKNEPVEGYFTLLGNPQTFPFKGSVATLEGYRLRGQVGFSFSSQGTQLPEDLTSYMDEVADLHARLKG
ncbi:MAG: flagellar brake protein [Proteobacteria bacterium]|nr:flagellar brake protein [Pseudomonadota bacterium]MBU1611131.1 flagellar brake protein [Pseudomonadota bacterium]